MYRIGKKFKFDAAHQLIQLPDEHKCSNLHGHTYEVEIVLVGNSLSYPEGWLYDYGMFKPFKEWLDKEYDHKFLNDVLAGTQTTAENLARILYYQVQDILDLPENLFVQAVRVSETPNTFAEYSEF